MLTSVKSFLKTEAAGGIVLMAVALLALLAANSPWAASYFSLMKPLTHPINDGLMAIFFLMVGLEIKRECVEGELSTRAKAMLPVGRRLAAY